MKQYFWPTVVMILIIGYVLGVTIYGKLLLDWIRI